MNEVQIFDGLKIKEENGQVMFEAETVAIGVGLTQVKNGKEYVRWERVNGLLNISPQVGKCDWITEPQMYTLAIKAENETANRFQKWVTEEVLPSIRKNGMFAKEELLDNPDLLIQTAIRLKEEKERRVALEAENAEMKPKALFADAVSSSASTILIGELAKLLKQNGINIGSKRLF